MDKKPIRNEALKSWDILNEFLKTSDEGQCLALLKEEKTGRARKQFIMRIHSRLNRVRAQREREELKASIGGGK